MANEIHVERDPDATVVATTSRVPPAAHAPAAGEPSLGELFKELAQESSTLIRQEVALAKTEMMQAVTKATADVTGMIVWGVVALVGVLVLVAAAVIGLGALIDNYWLSALIIGGVLTLVGALAAWGSMKKLKEIDFGMSTTTRTLQNDKAWAQREARDIKQDLTA